MVEREVWVDILPHAVEVAQESVATDKVDARVGTEETGDDGECGPVSPDIAVHEVWL